MRSNLGPGGSSFAPVLPCVWLSGSAASEYQIYILAMPDRVKVPYPISIVPLARVVPGAPHNITAVPDNMTDWRTWVPSNS